MSPILNRKQPPNLVEQRQDVLGPPQQEVQALPQYLASFVITPKVQMAIGQLLVALGGIFQYLTLTQFIKYSL